MERGKGRKEQEGGITKSHEETLEGVENVPYLDSVDNLMGIYFCQNIPIAHCKCVQFTVYPLYLDKVVTVYQLLY